MTAPRKAVGYHNPALSPNIMLYKMNLYPASKWMIMGSLGLMQNVTPPIAKKNDVNKIKLINARYPTLNKLGQEFLYENIRKISTKSDNLKDIYTYNLSNLIAKGIIGIPENSVDLITILPEITNHVCVNTSDCYIFPQCNNDLPIGSSDIIQQSIPNLEFRLPSAKKYITETADYVSGELCKINDVENAFKT